ncbi:MAG TPA: HAD-IB family phosphatase [Gemmatimonadaceae bacterium]|nr:HAD-IB family phosphatase [Gemmatimonadaceae bacterium]
MTNAAARGFASVVLDVDSTLCGIEGIDWLAELRGAAIGARVTELTDRAMRGELALDAVYGERLALVNPTRDEVAALANVYIGALAPGAARAVRRLREAGHRITLVSGGVREAILPVARRLGIPDDDVHAVSVRFADDGSYAGHDTASPLATSTGKRAIVESLALPRRILAVGDGATDLAVRPAVDAFAAFTGFVRRDAVLSAADLVVASFDQLTDLVLA